MSKKIKTVYDADKSAGNDPSKNYLIPTQDEANPDAAIALDIDQIAAAVSTRIGVSPPPEETENLAQLVITIQDNTLTPNLRTITGIDYTHYAVITDDPTVPSLAFFEGGPAPALLEPLAGWAAETKYVYLYDSATDTIKPLTDADGTSGIVVTPNATAPPAPITDFTSDSSTDTTATVSFSSTTIIDGITLVYDIVNTYVLGNDGLPTLVNSSGSDVIPGSVTVTGLAPGTEYSLAVRVTPENDLSRAYYSDPDPISTTSAQEITFTGFVLADGGTNEDDAVISTFTTTGSPDQWYWSLTPTAPTVDSTWLTPLAVATDEISLGSPGTFSVYAYVSDTSDPTNIVPFTNNPATVTLAPDSGTDIFSIDADNSDLVISEMGAPSGTITVIRSATSGVARTVDITSTNGTAIAGTNFKNVDTTLSFGAGDTSVTVDYDVLQTNMGHDSGVPETRDFILTLSNPSAGSINVANGSATVTIKGSNGYVGPNPDAGLSNALNGIDVNNPPTNLTKLSGIITPTAGTTYDGYELDALGQENLVRIGQAANNITFKRSILKNSGKTMVDYRGWASGLTITNCIVKDWHTTWQDYLGPRWGSNFLNCYPLSYGAAQDGETTSDITIRGVKARGHGSFTSFQFTRNADNTAIENNHFYNTTNLDIGMTRADYITRFETGSFNARDGRLYLLQGNTGGGNSIRDNVYFCPRSGDFAGNVYDCINFGGGSGSLPNSEAGRSFVEGNLIDSCVDSYEGSAFGVITDFPDSGGYVTVQYNAVIEMPNGAYSCHTPQSLFRRNLSLASASTRELSRNGVGVTGSNSDGTNEVTDNDIWWHQINPDTLAVSANHTWNSPTVVDPIGFSSQNIQNGTGSTQDWSAGDSILKSVKAILNNPAIDDGIKCKYASYQCVSGNGVLRWDQSTDTLYFTAYGDSEGIGVSVNVLTNPDGNALGARAAFGDWQYDHLVYSADTRYYIKVVINPSVLASTASETYRVKVTDFPVFGNTMIMPYDQDTLNYADGAWGGTETVTTGGSTKPAIPTSLAAANGSNEGEVDLTWDDMSLPGYRVYRDDVLIASPITNSYTDTGRTNGVEYAYQVASLSADTPPVVSDLSAPVNFTPTTGLDNQLEDLDNDTYWGSSNLSSPLTDNGDSTYTLTNSTTTTGYRKYEFGPGSSPANAAVVAGHTYRITWKHMRGTANGRITVNNDVTEAVYTGDLYNSNLTTDALTEYSTDVVPAGTTLQIYFWVNNTVSGATTIYTTPTVEDLDA